MQEKEAKKRAVLCSGVAKGRGSSVQSCAYLILKDSFFCKRHNGLDVVPFDVHPVHH